MDGQQRYADNLLALTMQARILADSQPHWSCLKKASQVENLGEAVLRPRQTVRIGAALHGTIWNGQCFFSDELAI